MTFNNSKANTNTTNTTTTTNATNNNNETVIAKVKNQTTGESRKMNWPREYPALVQKITEIFAAAPASLSYRDEDNDVVVFSSQEEYEFALAHFDRAPEKAILTFSTDSVSNVSKNSVSAVPLPAASAPPASETNNNNSNSNSNLNNDNTNNNNANSNSNRNSNHNSNNNTMFSNAAPSAPPAQPTHAPFRKVWKVTNQSSQDWPAGVRLIVAPSHANHNTLPQLVSSDVLNRSLNAAPIKPGAALVINAHGTVPLVPGQYVMKYRMVKPAAAPLIPFNIFKHSKRSDEPGMERFGPHLWLDIEVAADLTVTVLDDDAGVAAGHGAGYHRGFGGHHHGHHGHGGHVGHGHGHGHGRGHPGFPPSSYPPPPPPPHFGQQPQQHYYPPPSTAFGQQPPVPPPGNGFGMWNDHPHRGHHRSHYQHPSQAWGCNSWQQPMQPMQQPMQQQPTESYSTKEQRKEQRKALKARITAAKKSNNIDDLVAILAEFGFDDEARNRELLAAHNNKVRKVCKILLHQQQQQPQQQQQAQQQQKTNNDVNIDDEDEDGDD